MGLLRKNKVEPPDGFLGALIVPVEKWSGSCQRSVIHMWAARGHFQRSCPDMECDFMLLVVHKTWLQSNPSLIVQATIYGEEVHTLVETSSAFTTIQPRPVSIRSGLGDPPPQGLNVSLEFLSTVKEILEMGHFKVWMWMVVVAQLSEPMVIGHYFPFWMPMVIGAASLQGLVDLAALSQEEEDSEGGLWGIFR